MASPAKGRGFHLRLPLHNSNKDLAESYGNRSPSCSLIKAAFGDPQKSVISRFGPRQLVALLWRVRLEPIREQRRVPEAIAIVGR
jgi:hypothetical protein